MLPSIKINGEKWEIASTISTVITKFYKQEILCPLLGKKKVRQE